VWRGVFRRWIGRGLGVVWLLGWGVVLYAVVAPWRELGGLVGERLRWGARFSLCAGVILGYGLGDWCRQGHPADSGRAHLVRSRRAVLPAAVLTAAALVWLRLTGRTDPIGVVTIAFLAYWAGWDVAFGAAPLIEGRLPAPDGCSPEAERLVLAKNRGSGKIHS